MKVGDGSRLAMCLKTMGSILFGGSRSGFRRLDDMCTLIFLSRPDRPVFVRLVWFIIYIRRRSNNTRLSLRPPVDTTLGN